MEKYYVYQLRLERSELPFYIGKGSSARSLDHYKRSSLAKNSHKNNIIKKAMRENVEVLSEILFDGLSEEQAHAKEIELIAFYGRRVNGGCLTNATDGGEGTSGWKPSEETRRKMSKAKTGKKRGPMSEETKMRISSGNKGKKCSPESIEKTASANRGRKHTPESRAKMSAARVGKRQTPESIRAIKFGNWDKNPAWKQSGAIYDAWLNSGKPGRFTIGKMFPGMRVEGMLRIFTGGWCPHDDGDWIAYSKQFQCVE